MTSAKKAGYHPDGYTLWVPFVVTQRLFKIIIVPQCDVFIHKFQVSSIVPVV